MTHDRDKIFAAAKEADSGFTGDESFNLGTSLVGLEAIEYFYAIAFEAGRQADKAAAERYRFLRGYMASERTDLDDELVSACSTNEPEILDEFIDSSIRARSMK